MGIAPCSGMPGASTPPYGMTGDADCRASAAALARNDPLRRGCGAAGASPPPYRGSRERGDGRGNGLTTVNFGRYNKL